VIGDGVRVRRSNRWSWIAVLVGGIVLFELVRRTLVRTGNPNLLPALILLGAAIVPASFVTLVSGRRLSYDVPASVTAGTALVGGVIGVVVAGSLEFDTLRRLGAVPDVSVGLIEEAAKLVVPALVLVLFPRRFRSPADGLVLGVASGAGFAALETMGYAFVALVQSRGDLATVDDLLLVRGLLSPAAHMAWTGLAATALWSVRSRGWSLRALGGFAGAYVLASGLHAAWDSATGVVAYAVLAAVSLGLLVWTTHRLAAGRPTTAVHASRPAG